MKSDSNRMGTLRLYAGLILLIATLAACGGGSGGETDNDTGTETDTNTDAEQTDLTGSAQKGPFQPGGEAVAVRLADDGSSTRDTAIGAIGEDGGYSINAGTVDWSGPTLLQLSCSKGSSLAANRLKGVPITKGSQSKGSSLNQQSKGSSLAAYSN